ncbi:MAG: 7TM diverse intracellular signaling domain-containing protein, partial [Cytophagales bacterium]
MMTNRFIKYLTLLLSVYGISSPVLIKGEKESFLIDKQHIEYFQTKESFSIEEVVKNKNDWFKSVETDEKFFKIYDTDQYYWLKIEFENQSMLSNWIFENADSHIDRFDYFILTENGEISKPKRAGYALPFKNRDFKYKNFLFEFSSDSKFTVFICAKSSLHNSFVLKVSRLHSFLGYSLTEYVALGFFYGLLMIMMAYNLISFLITKDRLFLFYSLYVVCAILITMSEDGLGFQYLWGSYPFLNKLIFSTSPTLFVLFLSLYSSEFLDLNKNGFLENKWMRFTIVGLIIMLIFNLLQVDIPFDEWFLLIPYLLILNIALSEHQKGNRFAPYFITAFGFVAFGAFSTTLRMNGIISGDSVFGVYLFNFCIVIEVLLFAVFQSEKFRILKKEKERAD